MSGDFSITLDKAHTSDRRFILQGRITASSADILRHRLNEAFRDGYSRFILNMRQVNFLSSGGIRVLLMFYKRATQEGGRFYVEDPSENVINVLGMTALDEMLLK